MQGFRAMLYKDIQILVRPWNLLLIFLPIFLFLSMQVMSEKVVEDGLAKPFAVGVRDQDQTMMSKTLIKQMKDVELFSSIEEIGEEEDNGEAFQREIAAVFTIPKDFFYDAYYFQAKPVEVVSNINMPVQSEIFTSIFSSIMNIMQTDQAVARAVHHFTGQSDEKMYENASLQLLSDALGRQSIFKDTAQKYVQGQSARVLATVLFLSAFLSALAIARNIPREINQWILVRYQVRGGKIGAFFLSKIVVLFLCALPVMFYVSIFFQKLLLLYFISLLSSFIFLAGISVFCKKDVQKVGNMLALLLLVSGGTLWGKFRIPFHPIYAFMAMDGTQIKERWILYLPALGMMLLGILLFGIYFFVGRRKEREHRSSHFLWEIRLLRLVGSRIWLVIWILVAATFGLVIKQVNRPLSQKIKLYVVNESGDEKSRELWEELQKNQELELIQKKENQAKIGVLFGEAEGMFVLRKNDYEYIGVSGGFSQEAIREIIAGKVIAMRSKYGAKGMAEKILKRKLTEDESQELLFRINQEFSNATPLYSLKNYQGATQREIFSPNALAIVAMEILFLSFSLSLAAQDQEEMDVQRRLSIRKRRKHRMSILCVMASFSFLIGLETMVIGSSGQEKILTLVCFSLWATGFSALLSMLFSYAIGLEGMLLYFVLLLCLWSGCFVDISHVSRTFSTISQYLPMGMIWASRTSYWQYALICVQILVFFLGYTIKSSKNK